MNRSAYDIVIIGASAAGVSAVEAIADRKEPSRVLLIGDEDRLPYKRTKVSKTFAAGFDRDDFALLDRDWYRTNGIDLRLGTKVVRINPSDRSLVLEGGEEIVYGRLIIATGAAPRAPGVPEDMHKSVFFATSASEVEELRAAAGRTKRAVVVGAGILGCEVTEQLIRMGLEVHLIGWSARLMEKYLNAETAGYLAERYRCKGVHLYLNSGTPRIEHTGSEFEVVAPNMAAPIRTELLVFTAGVEPRTELARAAGLDVNEGILVGPDLRTSDDNIFAAGDVAELRSGLKTHLWRNALEQGAVAGANAAGADIHYHHVPFRVKCEVFGHYFFSLSRPSDFDDPACDMREYDGGRYVCAYLKDGRVQGVIMQDDKENQKRYMQAANERWELARFESEFSL